ncbi:MAG: hypothetical protein KF723_22485 [Rhizobiaceae bacterium]|nr:hypothetical protein [Rhizobiaceae bacterium]
MTEVGHMPFWLKCGKCGNCWEIYKTPIDMGLAAKLMSRALCTACGATAKHLLLAKQENGILLEGRPEPDKTADIEGRAAQWRRSSDTGQSSIAIWEVMTGVPTPRTDHPHDPDDLGRCLRLLDLIPEWKPRLNLMCGLSKYWDALVQRWPEIEASYQAKISKPVGAGNWGKTYSLMRSILDPIEKADPRVVRVGDMTITMGAGR